MILIRQTWFISDYRRGNANKCENCYHQIIFQVIHQIKPYTSIYSFNASRAEVQNTIFSTINIKISVLYSQKHDYFT